MVVIIFKKLILFMAFPFLLSGVLLANNISLKNAL